MKQGETLCVALNRDDAMILTENNNGLYPKEEKWWDKTPRLVINTASYSDDNAAFPAQSIVLYNDPVKKLYLALKAYFEDTKEPQQP